MVRFKITTALLGDKSEARRVLACCETPDIKLVSWPGMTPRTPRTLVFCESCQSDLFDIRVERPNS